MKLLRKTTEAFTFELEWIERFQLQEVLRHYPLTPLDHYQIARNTETGPRSGDQPLLEEAMAAHQQSLRQKIHELLMPGRRFAKDADTYLLTLQGEEVEWLLQALNDVRVGCWVHMGCPEEERLAALNKTNAGYHVLMETALMFQAHLLHALHESDGNIFPEEPTDDEP